MSAIDTTFHWVKNPTAINGLATTYVSKRGSDTTCDGTVQNPYASIAKATSVATLAQISCLTIIAGAKSVHLTVERLDGGAMVNVS